MFQQARSMIQLALIPLIAAFLSGCGEKVVEPTADEIKAALNELVDRKDSKMTNVWEVDCDDEADPDSTDGGVIWACSYTARSSAYGTEQMNGVFLYVDDVLKEAKKYKRERAEQAGEAQQ